MVGAFDAAVRAVDPYTAVGRHLGYSDGVISVGPQAIGSFRPQDIVVIGIGKAAIRMVGAAVDVTGATRGLVVSPYPGACALPVVIGGHPIPDATSLAAGRAMSDLAASIVPTDCVLAFVSGGGSAALELPVEDVGLEDLQVMNQVLVASGAPIEDINEIRAAVSMLKAGGLRRMIDTTHMATMVLSDVPTGGPPVVSSGPTVASALGSDAHDVVVRWDLAHRLPACVVDATLAIGNPVERIDGDVVVEVGSPVSAAAAAVAHLRNAGFAVEIRETPITGDVNSSVEGLLAAAASVTVVAAGEATVRGSHIGVGGRNQHAALLAAAAIAGTERRFGALGTDGVDGETAAAGAIVDGTTVRRAHVVGYDTDTAIKRFDSHPLLAAIGDVVITGPTGTNVADVWIATPSRSA